MDPRMLWTLVAIAIIVVGAVAWYELRRRRTAQLKDRFRSEYDRAVLNSGGVRAAEAALEARAKHVAHLNIQPLAPEDAAHFTESWRRIQVRFVDDPQGAVSEADRLVGDVMHARGYPVGDFEQQVADISVDHPDVVMNYRAARDIAQIHARGETTTEDLRQAMVHYRALFTDLLQTTGTGSASPAAEKRHIDDHTVARSRR